jgi:hypothetical protein
MGKLLEQTVLRRMANEYKKKYSTSLPIKEMQQQSCQECRGKGTFMHC